MSIRQLEYQGHNISDRATRILPIEHTFDSAKLRWEVLTEPNDIAFWLHALKPGDVVACDTETSPKPEFSHVKDAGLDPYLAQVTTIQLSKDGSNVVMFSAATLKSNDAAWDVFNSVMNDPDIVKVFHNAKFDMKMLHCSLGTTFSNVDDTMGMRKLLTAGLRSPETRFLPEGRPMRADLQMCALDYLGYHMEKETREEFFAGTVTDITKMPEHMLRYAAMDVYAVWEIRPILLKYLEIENTLQVYEIIEKPLTWVTAKMELQGIRVDSNYLKNVIQPMLEEKIWNLQTDLDNLLQLMGLSPKKERRVRPEEFDLKAKGYTHVNDYVSLNVNAHKALKETLNNMGLALANTKAATLEQPTYTPESMAEGRKRLKTQLSPEDHFSLCMETCKKVLELKKSRKGLGTFVIPLQGEFNNLVTGRVHCDLNQYGAGTGRYTHANPNLAQMPAPNAEGIFGTTPLRKAFIPEPGQKFSVKDYSSCELYILAEITQDAGLIANVALSDPHTANAAMMFNCALEAVTKTMRQRAKAGIYLKSYGGGANRLAVTLGISVEEAREVLRLMDEAFAGMKDYERQTKAIAVQKGYATTLSGRKRYFDLPNREDMAKWQFNKAIGEIERAALNHPIQGTNADITKLAMVFADEAIAPLGGKLLLTVHDELVAMGPAENIEEIDRLLEQCMLEAEMEFIKSIPPKVSGGYGDSWEH